MAVREGVSRREGLVLATFLFLATSTTGFLQPFVPLYMAAAGLSRGEIGLVTGVATGLALLVQPVVGRLSDRLDMRRPFIIASALASGFAYMGFPTAHGVGNFLLLMSLGVNGAMYLSAVGGVLVGRMVRASRGGAAWASFRMWGSIGYVIISIATGLYVTLRGAPVSDTSALQPIFQYGPFLFLLISLIAWFLPDKKGPAQQVATREKAPLPANLRRFLIAYFLYSFALYGASPYISLFLKSLGATGLWITGTFTAGVIVEATVMSRSGMLSDIYGRRPLLAISMLILPIRLVLYTPATGPAWVAAVQALHGLNFGIVGAVAVAFAIDLATDTTHGQAQARLAAVAGFATAVGPIFLGYVSQVVGLRGMFGIAALVAVSGAAVMLFFVEDSHPNARPLASAGPSFLGPIYRLLDSPPRRRTRP